MTMMKRRNIIMVMMASLLLGSCSSDDILSVPNGNGRIRFDVGVSQSQEVAVTPMNGGATRSAEPLFLPTSSIEMHSGDMKMYANCASTADIPMHNIIPETTTRGSIQTEDHFYSNFGIFGYFYDSTQSWASINKSSIFPESSMKNLEVTQTSKSWTTDVYWPGGTKEATFFAYAPYNCQGAILESNTGAPKITYTVPSVIDEQKDLLVAKSTEDISCNGKDDVDFTFEHALTAIKFTQGELGDYTKITSITISGVKNKGELSLDGASWDNVSTTSGNSYTISSPAGITLNDVLLLMPQTLPSGAKLEVKMSNDDGTKNNSFSANLTGDWQKGYTVTYQLSVNKIFGDYVLEITPNTKVFDENGGDVSMTVKSYFEYSDGSKKPLPWTASYAYADGTDKRTPIDKALTGFSVSSSNGGTAESITAKIGKQYFKSNKTWSASEQGTEASPFDLSLYNPSSSTHTLTTAQSANCYVVNAPGWYKIPLYYGNSLNNSNGYGTETFQNHAGTKIDASNCNFSSSVSSGKLLWQDEYALITPTSISKTSDGQYLKFYVSPDAIAQGNAVIAALNSNDQILWSWHIWVTNMNLKERVNVLSGENRDTNYPFMTQPVGYCEASTLSYPQRDFIVTIQQGTSCKLAAARISQKSGTTLSVAQNCTFYQWGRKDPFPGAQSDNNTTSLQKLCYKADGSDFVYEKKGGNTILEDGKQSMAGSILNPTTFYYSLTTTSWASQDNDWCSTTYNDNWSMINTSINGNWADDNITKTVYDPCPIGFKMPGCNAFTRFTKDGNYHYSNDGHATCSGDAWKNQICVSNKNSYGTDKGWSFYTQADDTGVTNFWYAFGFIDCSIDRYSSTGKGCLAFAGFNGGCWTARAYSAGQGCDLYFDSGSVDTRFTDPRAYGFAARPVSE